MAIVGGRNIADEYYQIQTSNEFADFDLLVGGGPVADLSAAFDLFWNDSWSVPLAKFAQGDDRLLKQALDSFQENAESEEVEIYRKALDSEYINDVKTGKLQTFRGTGGVIVDDPEKLRRPPGEGPFKVGDSFYNTLLRARSEVLVVTPYFVPEDYGAEIFEKLAASGVRVRIVTNSLSATNHSYVHGGYAPYRKRLLASGIEFWEVRADAPRLVDGSDTPLVLHTKLAIVDRETLFVSSANVDPRSIRQNTEVAMVIKSPDLASYIQSGFETVAHNYVFKVNLKSNGALEWSYNGDSGSQIYESEPDASVWRKIVTKIVEVLPFDQQL